MPCNSCPLFSSWSNESGKGADCGIFGDSWDNGFLYEDKHGTVVGCYIDRHYILKREDEIEKDCECRAIFLRGRRCKKENMRWKN